MRTSRLAMLVAGAVMLTGIASISPASADAYDYPWCAQGPSLGYPGECAYRTYEQCLASVSGRYLYCGENPRFLFREPPEPRRYYRRHARPY
ncbi:DUF3551 domain-containing protein [Bradyrhizobium sp. ISRA443]|uniref:DUF3551 domain-containing protein n=1 Tax=Bradyrhizobium sp. ISRA443 TaxID=2866198 RepID=UPI0024788160|nr:MULTISPECIES: DUF3551 domain-containing protein [unclassified Bradyrhizobium]WGR94535.1 DUF3551 domain-containing protein [Bradyrhizobium sp. ISRA435]WGR99283.1 DUF3551 domain-containing protein [Bradyrhizobium sp. ISRA436]WGS06175.1 DUF3551 domain-containing protein [Bradyrhizobium sp. ISRA437]WGS13060.1 DUF3551 domain-containing protein [Bradyrhizobium sp. ISRA443]